MEEESSQKESKFSDDSEFSDSNALSPRHRQTKR